MHHDLLVHTAGDAQSQQNRPFLQPVVVQSGGGGAVHPVASDPGGQHCAAIVTV